jgi:Ca2+-binding RTX toxin-like protein
MTLFLAAMVTVAALALPAAASAFQTVSLTEEFDGSKTITITGDKTKPADLVTISYDSATNEFIIGHDIDMATPPAGCHFVGSGPPYKVLRCPASLVTVIHIDTGGDKDSVVIDGLINPSGTSAYLAPELNAVDIKTGAGNDKVSAAPWTGSYRTWATASVAGNTAVTQIDTGSGVDSVTVENGINTVAFGGSGKFTASGGTNTVSFGAGNSKFTGGAGIDVATFGSGNSTFTGSGGSDKARFGAGSNKFSGGAGNDKAKLGAGNDSGSGGPGNDKLNGGAGNDHLSGNGGFDVLKGGGGHSDKCLAGGGGAKTRGCEKP